MDAGIRSMEGEGNERRFELSFSSEEPYGRWFGSEILDHTEGCMDLERLNSIGVLLFNHDTDRVLGKVEKAWNQEKRGMAVVEFDDDEAAETIRKKVAGGTLKGVSVRYSVDTWEEVMAGKKSSDGRFTGPCYIAKKWTPLEISIVSVPADPTVGVGRDFAGENGATGSGLDVFERMVRVNENRIRRN
ncbi:MAG: HK97 family phage prohead protease [Clostridium sp.]|nr:HK97 family phage prohead protease [Clostridium sp.]MBT9793671.1 caudovirus prohead protease [Clostridium sp. MCC334]